LHELTEQIILSVSVFLILDFSCRE